MFFSYEEILAATRGRAVNPFHGNGIDAITTDSRLKMEQTLFIAIPGEKFDGHDYLAAAIENGAVLLCIEEKSLDKLPAGVPAVVVTSTITAYQNLAAFHRNRINPNVIALTGSSGKTSTKEMLRAIFEQALGKEHVLATEGNTNNQIGVPQNLLRLNGEHRCCIIEMGTNHHGEIEPLSAAARPDAALIVSIGRCHLENLGSLEGVATEKSKIFKYLSANGCAVIPKNAEGFEIMRKAAGERQFLTFGTPDSDFEARYLGGNIRGSSFELISHKTKESVRVDWNLSGVHQAVNASGAAAIASVFGIPLKTIADGLKNCVLPGMRMKITDRHGAQWVNDAYNANPDSMRATLTWLSEFTDPERLLLVLGDMREVGDAAEQLHEELLSFAVSRFPGARIVAVGPFLEAAARNFKKVLAFPDSQSAADPVRKMAKPGDTVFLKASRGTRLELVEE